MTGDTTLATPIVFETESGISCSFSVGADDRIALCPVLHLIRTGANILNTYDSILLERWPDQVVIVLAIVAEAFSIPLAIGWGELVLIKAAISSS